MGGIRTLSLGEAVYCFLFYLLLIFWCKKDITAIKRNRKPQYDKILVLSLLLYSITSFVGGDYFNYEMMVDEYDFNKGAQNHGEKIYGYIISLVNRNYPLFRCVIWGAAVFVLCKIVKFFDVNRGLVFAILTLMYIMTFSYARATLAMCIFFLGVAISIIPNQKKKHRIIGLILICASFIFHRSMLLPIALYIVALFVPLNKKSIFIFIIALIIAIPYMDIIFKYFLSTDFSNEGRIGQSLQGYSNKVAEDSNWKGMIQSVFEYATYYIPMIVITHNIYFKNKKTIFPKNILFLYKLTFFIMMTATAMFFIDIQNKVFFYRVMYMSFIPLSILLAYLYQNKKLTKSKVNVIMNFAIFYNFMIYIHGIYDTL